MIYGIFISVFLLCFTIYQWWFQNSRFRQMPEVVKEKVLVFNRPMAWAMYSLFLFLLVLGLIGYQIYGLMAYIIDL